MNNYKDRISKQRNVWLNGKIVKDVTLESSFTGTIDCINEFYSLQKNDDNCSFAHNQNQFAHISMMIPKNKTDLYKKRIAYKIISDSSFGMIGRTPDFANTIIMAIATNNTIFGQGEFTNFSENCVNYYDYCLKNNLFVCHGSINPQIDRSKPINELQNKYGAVRVVSNNSNGITVSGAKMIVTLAPIADEILVFNMPGLKPGDEAYALAFAVPIGETGVEVICRKSLIKEAYSRFDHPIANKFDEIDAYIIFNEVFIPWGRVFVYKDVEKSNNFFDKTYARSHSGHQDIVRGLSKFEFVTGVAIKLARILGLDVFPNIQEKLGELLSYIEIVKAGILLSEHDATINENGFVIPSITAIQSIRYNFPKMYQTAVQYIQSFGAGSMLSVPHHSDFENNKTILNEAMKSEEINAQERAFLLNLAWDITGDAFGQRQLVYENYHAGDPMRIATQYYAIYDSDSLIKNINKILPPLN